MGARRKPPRGRFTQTFDHRSKQRLGRDSVAPPGLVARISPLRPRRVTPRTQFAEVSTPPTDRRERINAFLRLSQGRNPDQSTSAITPLPPYRASGTHARSLRVPRLRRKKAEKSEFLLTRGRFIGYNASRELCIPARRVTCLIQKPQTLCGNGLICKPRRIGGKFHLCVVRNGPAYAAP